MYLKSILSILLILVIATMAQLSVQEQWQSFKDTNNKKYESPEEEEKRYKIFQETVKKVEEHNKKYETGEVTYKMSVNKFADLTPEEFKDKYTGGARKPGSGLATAV